MKKVVAYIVLPLSLLNLKEKSAPKLIITRLDFMWLFVLFCYRVQQYRISIKKKRPNRMNPLCRLLGRENFRANKIMSHQEQDLWETKRKRPLKEQHSPRDPTDCFTVVNLLHMAPGWWLSTAIILHLPGLPKAMIWSRYL